MDDNAFDEALRLAAEVHRGQTDKAGQPYILHSIRVMLMFQQPTQRVVALLHDVVEDGFNPEALLQEIYGRFGIEVGDAVDALTHRRNEQHEDYWARVKANRLATLVKHADIIDNSAPSRLILLDEVTQQRLRAKYKRALEAISE